MTTTYNRITTGYLLVSKLDGTNRTYACTSRKGLNDLIAHLTGREPSTFNVGTDGLPIIPGIRITAGLHIYQ